MAGVLRCKVNNICGNLWIGLLLCVCGASSIAGEPGDDRGSYQAPVVPSVAELVVGGVHSGVLTAKSACTDRWMRHTLTLRAEPLLPLALTIQAPRALESLSAGLWDSAGGRVWSRKTPATDQQSTAYSFLAPLDGMVQISLESALTCESIEYTVRLDGAAAPASSAADSRYRVLIVTTPMSTWAPGLPMRAAERDGRLVRQMFLSDFGLPDASVLSLSPAAERFDVVQAIRTYLGGVSAEGTAVFYFSGHGIQTPNNDEESDPEPDIKDEGLLLRSSALLDDELRFMLGGLKAGHVLEIIDACHSAGVYRDGDSDRLLEKSVDEARLDASADWPPSALSVASSVSKAMNRDYVFLAASQETQPAYAPLNLGPGALEPSLFTAALVRHWPQALKAAPTSRFSELLPALIREVQEQCCGDHRTMVQVPGIGPLDGRLVEYAYPAH